ncbi:hypothetical protein NHJ6243_003499 [Beauveria neobassiana]
MAANPSNLPADTPIALTGAQETLLITLRNFFNSAIPACHVSGSQLSHMRDNN